MNLYALATEKLYGKLPKKTSLLYLKKDKTVSNIVDPSYLDNVKKSIQANVNLIMVRNLMLLRVMNHAGNVNTRLSVTVEN